VALGGLAALVSVFWLGSGMWFQAEQVRQARRDKRAEDADPDYVAPRPVIRWKHGVVLYAGIAAGVVLQLATNWNGVSVVLAFAGMVGMIAWARYDHEARKRRVAPVAPVRPHEDWTTRNRPVVAAALTALLLVGGIAVALDSAGLWDRFGDGAAGTDAVCRNQGRVVTDAGTRNGTANVPLDPLFPVAGTAQPGPSWQLGNGIFVGNVTVTWGTDDGQASRMSVSAYGPEGEGIASDLLAPGETLFLPVRGHDAIAFRLQQVGIHTAAAEITFAGTFEAESMVWRETAC